MQCEICPILKNPSNDELSLRLIETEHWVATLRRDQQFLGTAFVTARRHVPSLPELTTPEDLDFIEVRNTLIAAQQRAFGARVVNVSCLMNLAFDREGEGEPHVHYHFKPRYAKPVSFAGDTFTDEEFGRYITKKIPHVVEHDVALEIADELRSLR